MAKETHEEGYSYLISSKSGSLTMSCVSAVLAVTSLVAIPLIGFFVALAFTAIAIGFWRRYLSGLSLTHTDNEIDRIA